MSIPTLSSRAADVDRNIRNLSNDNRTARLRPDKSPVPNRRRAKIPQGDQWSRTESSPGHRSNFASVSLEMTSQFQQTHSSLRDFTIEIRGSIQSRAFGAQPHRRFRRRHFAIESFLI